MKRVIWACCLISAIFSALWPLGAAAQGFETLRFEYAQAVLMPHNKAPTQDLVSLPHRWDKHFPKQGGKAIYSVTIPSFASNEPMGFYFARLGNQAHIYLNDQLIGQYGTLGDAGSDYSKAPQWLPVPGALFLNQTQASNRLRIEITVQAGRWGGLTRIELGSERALKPTFASNYQARTYANLLAALAFLILGTMVLALWFKQRQAIYIYFVLGASFGALRALDKLWITPPLPWPYWGIVVACALAFMMLAFCGFSLQVCGLMRKRYNKALLALAAFLSTCAALGLLWPEPRAWTLGLSSLALPLAFTLYKLCLAGFGAQKQPIARLMFVGMLVFAAVASRDFLGVRLAEGGLETFSFLIFAALLFVILMAGLIVSQFLSHFKQAQHLGLHLAQELLVKEAEIKHNFALLSAEQQRRAVLQERQRMMMDIHDGVGAHLVGMVHAAGDHAGHSAELKAQALAALDELRMAVDALQDHEGDLNLVLAKLRYRLEPRLARCQLALQCDMDEFPAFAHLSAHAVLQIQRIIFQAVSNVIEHAQATRVTFKGRIEAANIVLSLQDNGVGLPTTSAVLASDAGAPTQGAGIVSMHHRALDLGAQMHVSSPPQGGCNVRLVIPMSRLQAPPAQRA